MAAKAASRSGAEAIAERSREPMAFFPHDSTASQDLKCQRLLHRRGFDGYGRWWRLCELLASTEGHEIPVETVEDICILAGALGFGTGGAFDDRIAAEECRAFVDDLIDIGLVELEDGAISSTRMMKNAAYFGRQKHNGSKGGRPRKNAAEKG